MRIYDPIAFAQSNTQFPQRTGHEGADLQWSSSVLPFQPKHCLGHPKKHLFLSSKNKFVGLKYPEKN